MRLPTPRIQACGVDPQHPRRLRSGVGRPSNFHPRGMKRRRAAFVRRFISLSRNISSVPSVCLSRLMPFVRSLASPSVKAVLGSSVLFLVPVPRQDFGASFWLAILFAPLPDGIYFAWIRTGYWLWTLLLQTLLFFTLLFFFRRHLRTRWIGAILLALPPLLSYPICFTPFGSTPVSSQPCTEAWSPHPRTGRNPAAWNGPNCSRRLVPATPPWNAPPVLGSCSTAPTNPWSSSRTPAPGPIPPPRQRRGKI